MPRQGYCKGHSKFARALLLIVFVPLVFSCAGRLGNIRPATDAKVYVALGFHGNLYHSFRADTNDEAGFGKDIRVIRHTIRVLDACNRKGVPVKGVWDIENLFSLQETLPKYAPDIIEDIKRRVAQHQDEVILMSYNNGLASASTKTEFRDCMSRAIRNPQQSGVADIFGAYGKIVRPQEMMTTPGNFSLYRELGIKAISLYYSAITFDTFRVFVPPLSMDAAHNPLLYQNPGTGETITVIPTYNIGDLIENISLRHWVRKLRKLQLEGEIQDDVLVFINFDADDEYWYGYDLPAYLAWLPNTGGLEQLIEEVDDLAYVKFTNLSDYLETHPPRHTVFFGQDTADGSFDGYNSWSEKAYVTDYWTHLAADRRNQRLVPRMFRALDRPVYIKAGALCRQAYEARLRLLSTTNYGMATPYLAKARERVVEQLIRDMNQASQDALAEAERAVRANIDAARVESAPASDWGRFFIAKDPAAGGNGNHLFLSLPVKGQQPAASAFVLAPPNGRQYAQPTWSNGQGFEAAFITGQQYESAGPTYNGHALRFSLMLAFFQGDKLPEAVQADLLNFAHPPMVVGAADIPSTPPHSAIPRTPKGFFALYGDDGVYFHWEKAKGEAVFYKIRCGRQSADYTSTFKTTDTMLHVRSLSDQTPFELGKTYYAVVQAVGENGQASEASPEIAFTLEEPPEKSGPGVPLGLQLKILGSSLKAKFF